MANHWYFTHEDLKSGPFSDQQLRDLADTGQILPTDTVWKNAMEQGVLASKVKNLFSPAEPAATPAATAMPITKVHPAAPASPPNPGRVLPPFASRLHGVDARIRVSAAASTGFTRCSSNPASRDRRRSSACP